MQQLLENEREASPAQLAAWRQLWALLLAPTEDERQRETEDEARRTA
ncbi:MAG: hypothetical protein M0Z94_01100 [Dehalococcoidales bacterium]|nr:hypothetical protein [Dehalococcoidales bacterium]